jgi:hypothetical protein
MGDPVVALFGGGLGVAFPDGYRDNDRELFRSVATFGAIYKLQHSRRQGSFGDDLRNGQNVCGT